MDLFLQLGRYDTITDMLNTLDCVEYDFLLEKYRKMTYGPSMVNYQLAQVAWAVVNTVSKKTVAFKRFIKGELGDPETTSSDGAATSLMAQDYYDYYLREGFSEDEARKLARDSAKKYADDLRQKRLEEAMEIEEQQDLSNA